MPLVFIHGVKTRSGKEWDKQRALRESLFRRFALQGVVDDPKAVHYDEPLWGDLAAKPRWNNASLPSGKYESFAPGDPDRGTKLALLDSGFEPVADAKADRRLLETVRRAAREPRSPEDRQPLEELVDVLWLAAAARDDLGDPEALAEFGRMAVEYARSDSSPDWLGEVETDVALVNRVLKNIADRNPQQTPRVESFGFQESRQRFVEAVQRVGRVADRFAGRAVTTLTRRPAQSAAAMFLGDVVVYLNERGTVGEPGAIVKTVAKALDDATARITPADPKLVVVAHSMGGNITYDLLTYFRPDLKVDVLLTVGSQVAFFEELSQFRISDHGPVDDPETFHVPKPDNVGRWINVFDRNDLLGFVATPVFSEVEDYEYSTGMGAIKAHGSYLTLPSFHDRFRERLKAAWNAD